MHFNQGLVEIKSNLCLLYVVFVCIVSYLFALCHICSLYVVFVCFVLSLFALCCLCLLYVIFVCLLLSLLCEQAHASSDSFTMCMIIPFPFLKSHVYFRFLLILKVLVKCLLAPMGVLAPRSSHA